MAARDHHPYPDAMQPRDFGNAARGCWSLDYIVGKLAIT